MASEPNTSRPEDTTPGASSDLLTVNLQIVSPSVGVNRPLLFPGLVATTTVKQLKERIRQSLPVRPADENQRLIHRGRAIVRETDTLLDIFGADTLRTPDQQTIHLVIRDTHDSHAPAPQVSARGPSPTAPTQQPNPPRQHVQPHPFGPQPPPGFARRPQVAPTANPFPQQRMPSPSPIHTPEQAAAFQQHHQNMTQWLNQIQREAMARAIVNQNQRARAQMGMRGIGDPTVNGAHGADNSGRASPAPGHTVYREHVGPNGHTYQVETVLRTAAPNTPNGGMSPAEVQGILRGADANQAALAMTSAMQRSASSTSLHNRPLAQPGITTPVYPMTASGRATPDPAAIRAAAINNAATRQGPEVYILSSPEGPRALLFNSASSETYYTPRLRTQASFPQIRPSHPSALGNVIYDTQGQARARHHHHHHHHHHRPHTHQPQSPQQQQGQQQQQQQPQPQPQPQAQLHQRQPHHHHQPQNPPQPVLDQADVQFDPNQPVIGMHHGNPPVAALPPLLMQLWPHIWLVFRLALFVWFFTNPNASWSRWFTIICIAFFIFILSTGVLNGIPDHIWRPLGRHLENLIPLEPRQNQAAGQNQQNGAPDERHNPNPADMAARLVAERRGADGWFVVQMRRLERAGLLFLASIAPGVAERHIANLEATARAERERREAAAAAAAAAAQSSENNGENSEELVNEDNEAGQRNGNDGEGQPQPQPDQLGQENNRGDMAREQLIAV